MTCPTCTSAGSVPPSGATDLKYNHVPRQDADHGPAKSTAPLSKQLGALHVALAVQREIIAAKRLRQIRNRQHRAASLTCHELRAVTHEVLRREVSNG